MNTIKRWLVVILMCAFAWASPLAMAQDNSHTTEKEASKGLFALKTNLLEWTAAIPNLSVMADLSGKPWNRSVAALTLKYKWKTSEAYVPSYMLNLLEIRPEYRYYLNNKFYVGGYAAYSSFTAKLPNNPTGWTGFAAGGGASGGMELPLYQYRKSALDIEFGLSLGAHYAFYRDFTANADQTGIEISSTPARRVLPYPELRVALVWRKTSVKDKYNETDPMKALYAQEKESIQINLNAYSMTCTATTPKPTGPIMKPISKRVSWIWPWTIWSIPAWTNVPRTNCANGWKAFAKKPWPILTNPLKQS